MHFSLSSLFISTLAVSTFAYTSHSSNHPVKRTFTDSSLASSGTVINGTLYIPREKTAVIKPQNASSTNAHKTHCLKTHKHCHKRKSHHRHHHKKPKHKKGKGTGGGKGNGGGKGSGGGSTNGTNTGGITGSRLELFTSLYAYAGFVYDVENCPSASQLKTDLKAMKAVGTRAFITFGACDNNGFWDQIILAAQEADLYIIPLVWTLLEGNGDTIQGKVQPRINAITQSVIKNPSHVLGVALGDEPLFDQDFGSNDVLAQKIKTMKNEFKKAGHEIPVSISDMAYGWQQAGDINSVADAVDVFMVNSFPYFSTNAAGGGDAGAWDSFLSDLSYFKGISKGKPIMVTQTGWPSNKNEFNPNSGAVQATLDGGEIPFVNLLNSHCSWFKQNKIGWMWRDWNDNISGWGYLDGNNQPKFKWNAKTTC